MARHLLCWMVLGLVLGLVAPAYGDGIWWQDQDGTSGTLTATWDNLQTAITSAQAGTGGSTREVRINGNVTRAATDVAVSLDVSGTGNVRISGAWDATYASQTDSLRSTLDCQPIKLKDENQLMNVSAGTVTLDNLWLKNGRSQAGTGLNVVAGGSGLRVTDSIISDNSHRDVNGIGVSIADVNDVKISRTIIANNGGFNVGGGGVYVGNAGEEAAPVVLEYCHIAQNYGGDHSSGVVSGVYATGTSHVTIANSRFTDNNVNRYADALYTTAERVIVFGTLFDGQDHEHWGTRSPVIRASRELSESLVLANCTVADNETSWIMARGNSTTNGGDVNMIAMINTLVGVTDPTSTTDSHDVENARRSSSQGYLPHMLLQNNTFSADTDPPVNTTFSVEQSQGPVVVADLAAALSTLGPWGRYRFHALDPSTGAILANPLAGANQEEDIAFVLADDLTGATPADRAYLYSLESGTPSTFSGTTQTGAGYVYVDIDHDGVFDPTLDVVVSGAAFAPGSALYVYDYDLSVLGRVTRSGAAYIIEPDTVLGEGLSALALGYASNRYLGGIDRGAYQSTGLPIPEPATLGLLLLGLPLLRRRRRT